MYVKNIEVYMLKINSPDTNSYDLSQYTRKISNVINEKFDNIRSCLDGRLVETVDKIKS